MRRPVWVTLLSQRCVKWLARCGWPFVSELMMLALLKPELLLSALMMLGSPTRLAVLWLGNESP